MIGKISPAKDGIRDTNQVRPLLAQLHHELSKERVGPCDVRKPSTQGGVMRGSHMNAFDAFYDEHCSQANHGRVNRLALLAEKLS